MVRISTDLGMPVAADYADKLSRMESKQPENTSSKVFEEFTKPVQKRVLESPVQLNASLLDEHEDVTGLLPE